jgi:Ankyrin repeats (3 copies)
MNEVVHSICVGMRNGLVTIVWVIEDRALIMFMRAISSGDSNVASQLLEATPELAFARLVEDGSRASAVEFFLPDCGVYMYAGHTALHVAAAAYNTGFARTLVGAGADVRAKNRRGAEPLHEAVRGGPGSAGWDPQKQVAMVVYLIDAGADPDAVAAGGVTPLHRAVRNRCAAAVRALLDAGADPQRPNNNRSTAIMLARWTTGRPGSGSPEAKAEQDKILSILNARTD